MSTQRQRLGAWGETRAKEYLEGLGYTLVARNFRTPYGELDLIVQMDEILVFVEVKTRSSQGYGPPEAAVTPQKQEHIIASAQYYLQTYPEIDGDWRVDVIAVQRLPGEKPQITHFENALYG